MRTLSFGQKLRFWAVRLRRSAAVRDLEALRGRSAWKAIERDSADLLFDVNGRAGLGGILSFVLRLYAWAEHSGRTVRVISTSPLYSPDGEDVLGRFFRSTHDSGRAWRRVPARAADYFYRFGLPEDVPLADAQRLARRFLQPDEAFARHVADLAGDGFDLAIHFRGTDKFLDSGLVQYDLLLSRAHAALDSARRVFLATDDAEFARLIRQRYPGVEFVSYDLGEVPAGQPRHFSELDPLLKAQEALTNMFLIARAPVCFRTSSFLSSFSKIINDSLRTVTVNKTVFEESPFPEKQVLQAESAAPPPNRQSRG